VTAVDETTELTPGPERTRGNAPATIRPSDFNPGQWAWRCHIGDNGLDAHTFTGHGLAPTQPAALAALAQHQRESHPGRALGALAAAHMRRIDVAYNALCDAGLVPVVNAAGVDVLEAAHLLAQDPAGLAMVRQLAREMTGGEPG
jgi:hypothetical protein